MNCIFKSHLRNFVLAFFDDILIYNKDKEEHLRYLERVLLVLEKYQLFAQRSECTFGASYVEYLGYIICQKGVIIDPKKGLSH